MDKVREEILSKIIPFYSAALAQCDFLNLQEIRFRAQRPVMLYFSGGTAYLAKTGGATQNRENALYADQSEIAKQVQAFCRSSAYAYQEEIREGFLTIRGGHRVGISGKAVTENGRVTAISAFSGLNIRIAREYKGSADPCMAHIFEGKRILSSVILSPPGTGKTTVLRDAARRLSGQFKVAIVDERSELAASYGGVPRFDVGDQTDVLDAFPKPEGITCALRSLSPDVIVTDEIGTEADRKAVCNILKGGCKILTSMHGYSIEEALEKKKHIMELFETAILLERRNGVPEVKECIRL